jgi:chorismate synthase
MLRFYTAGESHGQALLAFLSGLPAGLSIDLEFINRELHRRQLGYGRGGRQKIEKDRADIFAGVRHGQTIGAPIALRIENRDWANWEKILAVEAYPEDDSTAKKLVAPRPGHADLAGSLKFNFHDARYILERASARETAARVAAGALAKTLLKELGTEIASHTIQVGHTRIDRAAGWQEIRSISNDMESPLRCVDSAAQDKMKAEVDTVLKAGDTVGGIFEIVAHNVPVGLGSHAQWDEKLDGRLAQADMVTKEPVQAAYERSDWCVVPAGAVVAEAMVALVLADAFLQKFGGDSMTELRRNFEGYARQISNF